MKIYLASRWKQRLALHPIREEITRLGHVVTSGWLDEINDPPEWAALRDLHDVDRADLLILWHELALPIQSLYGGMFVEVGFALGKHKDIWIVEQTEPVCIFTKLQEIKHFRTWEAVYVELSKRAKAAHTEPSKLLR